MQGRAALTWSPGIYGGHPVFAEGQGGYADPLNLFFAAVVTPFIGALRSMAWLHAATMLLGGVGMVALCRQLGLGLAAALFAAVATMFSPAFTQQQQNLVMSDSLCVMPCVLWAAEVWAARPGAWRGALLGASFAGAVVAGYPQSVHALALYVGVRFAAAPPRHVRENWRSVAGSLAVGAAVALGLAAIQWLPLLELVPLSHRAAGIGLLFPQTGQSYLRGMLFSPGDSFTFPGTLGSVLVCMLAPFSLLSVRWRIAAGHLAALLLMLMLGTEYADPLFPLLYDGGLIPGLHFFRLMQIYTILACPSLALLAAIGVDALANKLPSAIDKSFLVLFFKKELLSSFSFQWLHLLFAASLPLWVGIAALGAPAAHCVLQLAVAACAAALAFGLATTRHARWLAPAFLLLLLGETITLRFAPFRFFPADTIAEPRSVALLKSVPGWQAYRTTQRTPLSLVSLTSPFTPGYAQLIRNMLTGFVGMSPQLWGIDSLDGSLALALRRRALVDPVMDAEMAGPTASQPGSRVIDLLGVRELAVPHPCQAPGFLPALATPELGDTRICHNEFARPRLQLFSHAVRAASLEAAVRLARDGQVLVVEAAEPLPAARGGPDASSLTVEKARDTIYRATVTAAAPVWLFVADAPYPGWRADIDGTRTRVYPAQVLGRAVYVPAGTHRVVMWFVPVTVYVGGAITALTLAALVMARFWVQRQKPSRAAA